MFGRDLVEQVQADSQATGMPRHVPIIVEKCLEAVEQIGTCIHLPSVCQD